jgi:hypothetical protein
LGYNEITLLNSDYSLSWSKSTGKSYLIKSVAIYGAGSAGIKIADELKSSECKVLPSLENILQDKPISVLIEFLAPPRALPTGRLILIFTKN